MTHVKKKKKNQNRNYWLEKKIDFKYISHKNLILLLFNITLLMSFPFAKI